jgi:peptidoglycan hydrolase CwlO-like protein
MELSTYIIWNVFITLVLAPIFYSIRANTSENKRLDILLNKTREELAGQYVTKTELANDIDRILECIGKLEKKIDRLFDRDK